MMAGYRHSGIRTMRSFAHAEMRRLSSALLMIGLFALWLPGLFAQTPAVAESIVIRAGKLFDAESGQLTDRPVIVITGHTEQCTIDEAVRCGAAAYLAKPFETLQFISTIERALHPSRHTAARTI